MAVQPSAPLSPGQKNARFLVGFVGCLIVNGALAALVATPVAALISTGNPTAQNAAAALSLLAFIANGIALGGLVFIPAGRWVALGMLAALSFGLCIVLVLGVVVGTVCFGLTKPGVN